MKNSVRWPAALALFAALLILLCACGGQNKETAFTDEEGNRLQLSLDEIEEDGFYVLDQKNDLFSPVMGAGEGPGGVFSPAEEESRYLWFGSKYADLMTAIPRADGENFFLVMLQEEQSGMPDEYYVEKYLFLGYTLGVGFTFGERGDSLFIDSLNLCESSMAKDVITENETALLKVHKINGSEELPLGNVDTKTGKLLGLEKEKKYRVGYFDGTKYKDAELIADTALFRSKGVIAMNEPLRYTERGFAYIALPENLAEGYYDINGAGLFYYSPHGK